MNQKQKLLIQQGCWFRRLVQINKGAMIAVIGINSAIAGQAVTGKIVIDGVVYGESGNQIVKGSGDVGKETRNLGQFHSVKILTGVDFNYRYDRDYQVEIVGEKNLLPILQTRVESGVLAITSVKNFQHELPLTVEIRGPHLKSLEMHGAGDLFLDHVQENSFKLLLHGSGDVKVSGQVDLALITINGASDVDAAQLKSKISEVKLLGSGDVDIFASQKLTVDILGSGDVTYYGNPSSVEKRIIGSGDIEAGD